MATEPTGVNPLLAGGDRASQDLIDLLYLHLFEEQPDFAQRPPTFQPRLASDWSWSDDQQTLFLELRRGVRWTDGVEVTADDVRWTWQVQRDPRVGWRYAELKEDIADMRVTGRHRLEVRFAARSPSQLANLNAGNIMPRHAWGRLPLEQWASGGDWFRRNLVSNGPFVVSRWEAQQEVVLSANPDYFEAGLPALGRLTLRVVPLRANRLEELAAGRADFVVQLTPAEAARLESEPEVRVKHFWHRQYDYLGWNTRRPLLVSPEVRRALTMAIDRRALVDTLWHGRARVGVGPIPANVWAHHPDLEPWPFDPAAASQALTDAGWTPRDGRLLNDSGQPFEFELLVNGGNRLHADAAVLISNHLRKVGITADVRQLDFHAMIDRLDNGAFDAAIGAWGIDTSLDLEYAFHSRSLTEGYNSGGYSSPRLDALIEAARGESDIESRRRLLHEMQEIIHRDQPYTFLWEPPRLDAHSARLDNVRPNALSSLFRLREWRVLQP